MQSSARWLPTFSLSICSESIKVNTKSLWIVHSVYSDNRILTNLRQLMEIYNIPVQYAAKMCPLKFFCHFWATAWNFNVKFHTLITCLNAKRHLIFSYSNCCKVMVFLRDNIVILAFCTFKQQRRQGWGTPGAGASTTWVATFLQQLENCHMGSHSVTCHPTQVNTLRLIPSQTGWYLIYLPRRERRLSWPKWLQVTYRDGLPAHGRQPSKY